MKKFFWMLMLFSVSFLVTSCDDDDDDGIFDIGYRDIDNPNPLTTESTLTGEWLIEEFQTDVLSGEDEDDYEDLILTLDVDNGTAILSGGAVNTSGTFFFDNGMVEFNALGQVEGEGNELNDDWNTDVVTSNKIVLFDNDDKEKFILLRL